MVQRRWQVAACLGIYILASVVMGREVLAHLGDTIANDAGDPILTTTILHWVATHVPYTDAWYQFPIFSPSRDALTFSEHLLGVSVVAAPIEWITGSPVIAYNLTVVASFALSAAAMFALAWRLTGNIPASFIAGLAYGFNPYRISQLPHIQMEVLWYARSRCSACTPIWTPADAGGWRSTAPRGCCRGRPTGTPSCSCRC